MLFIMNTSHRSKYEDLDGWSNIRFHGLEEPIWMNHFFWMFFFPWTYFRRGTRCAGLFLKQIMFCMCLDEMCAKVHFFHTYARFSLIVLLPKKYVRYWFDKTIWVLEYKPIWAWDDQNWSRTIRLSVGWKYLKVIHIEVFVVSSYSKKIC